MAQTLGLDAPSRNRMIRSGAAAIAILLFVGFSAVPVSMVTNAIAAPDASISEEAHLATEAGVLMPEDEEGSKK